MTLPLSLPNRVGEKRHSAPRWLGHIAMTYNCCSTKNPPPSSAAKARNARWHRLKMAQAEYLAGIHGSAPILLIDDVMGELDVKRRSGLLPLLEHARKTSGQVFMTCTEENWPSELGKDLQRWEVRNGMLKKS